VRSAITAAYPRLGDSDIAFYSGDEDIDRVPAAAVAVAPVGGTAFAVAKPGGTPRKFYLVQDYEPMFYPAGTQFALAEESYRLGLSGLRNTHHPTKGYRAATGRRG